jgi:hypothetical protein
MNTKVNLDDLRRLRDEAIAAGPGTGRWIKAAQALMDQFPQYYATAKAMNAEGESRAEALRTCLDVLMRMIPEYLAEHEEAPQATDEEHNDAIARAALVLFGPDRARWPVGVRMAAEGQYQ